MKMKDAKHSQETKAACDREREKERRVRKGRERKIEEAKKRDKE